MNTSGTEPGLVPLNHYAAELFGGSFDLWELQETWQRIDGSDENASAIQDSLVENSLELSQLLDRAFQDVDQPLATVLRDKRILLVIPENTAYGKRLAAVGIVAHQIEELTAKFAASAMECRNQNEQLVGQEQELSSYAIQVSQDFEELAWLRSLADCLDCCDIANPLEEVAEKTVPALKEIIGAETLVLLSCTQLEGKGPAVGRPIVWSGEPVLDVQSCIQLVEKLWKPELSQALVLNHMQQDGEFTEFPSVHSCLLVPVAKRSKGISVGWLLALNRQTAGHMYLQSDALGGEFCPGEDEFGTVEASLLSSAAIMLATHARNIGLLHEKESILIGVIRSLINAMDAKDSYTCGHSDRVALISKRIGEELKLSQQDCDRLYMTGLLHDIGKIGVPDNVLLKNGRLSEDEFKTIKQHPVIGHEILKHLEQLKYVLPGVLHHHESFDGRGYPDGLAGEDIPIAARILAVADAYDAMSSTRPYRTAMSFEKVEGILRDGAGTQWDNKIVDVFFAALDDIRAIGTLARDHTQSILKGSEGSAEDNDSPDSIMTAVAAANDDGVN